MNTDEEIKNLQEHCNAANELFDKLNKAADEVRACYSKPVDVSVRLMQGDINLLKSATLQPPTNPDEKKYMLDLQRLTEQELAAHLVKIAVRKFVADYTVSLVNPSN